MFDLLKVNRINKITSTHQENISDYMILMNIVNSMDAKKNLSSEEFSSFCKTFDKIKQRKKETPTNSLQYENRAFCIAYEFEWSAEVPYEKICGDSTDILYMYSNKKPKFDESLNELITGFTDIIDSIIKHNGLDAFRVEALAVEFFLNATQTIIGSFFELRTDPFMCFLYEMAFKSIYLDVSQKYLKEQKDLDSFREYKKKMDDMHRETYDNTESLDDYITRYINSFMYFCEATDDMVNNAALYTWLGYLKSYGESLSKED